jgi:hypothetical protein
MSVTIENPAGATAIGPFTIPQELATFLPDAGRGTDQGCSLARRARPRGDREAEPAVPVARQERRCPGTRARADRSGRPSSAGPGK